jgi:DNA invertase Pin-like site-specific DNA recombinase
MAVKTCAIHDRFCCGSDLKCTIYEEHASGETTIRPELDACPKSLRKGDTLVVWRMDRFGWSLGDLIDLTTQLRSRGVDFELDLVNSTGERGTLEPFGTQII